ncbi:crossover junction endodeoxyribonuclease RuvC [Mycobacterium sp. NPDC050041]|uniref:crossover junction endodeoxyribonuclease RuvC n=1 Tax=Mycobacterium sp. NPDC050041 TaxID=3364293 RepID=UPI003C2B4F01
MIVAGIDPSLTNTGIAVLIDGLPELITSTGIASHRGANHQARSRRIRAVCHRVLERLPLHPDLVVIEGILEHGPMLPSAIDRHQLWGGIYAALDHRGIPTAVINPSTLKVWTTGHGRADKAMMLSTVRGWWPHHTDITDHDRADALGLAAIGAYHLGEPMPFRTKDRHRIGLEKVAWPERTA